MKLSDCLRKSALSRSIKGAIKAQARALIKSGANKIDAGRQAVQAFHEASVTSRDAIAASLSAPKGSGFGVQDSERTLAATPPPEPGNLKPETSPGATPAERFKETLPVAEAIARGYSNIPGVEVKDAEQHARIALVRAAREYDPAKGATMETFARRVVRNELNRLYSTQLRRTGREVPLEDDEQKAENGKLKAEIRAPEDTRRSVERAEGLQMLNDTIAELPGRMRDALLGVLSGEGTLEEIGAKMGGISRQAVQRLTMEGMRRLRGKLGERGVTSTSDLLAAQKISAFSSQLSALESALKAQMTDDPIAQLMALIDSDAIDEFTGAAEKEVSGARTVGRPDLSLGAEGPAIMGVDEWRKGVENPQTEEGWNREGEAMLAQDYEGTARRLAERALAGGTLSPAETKAAQMIVSREMAQSLTPERRGRLQALIYAYRATGTEAGRTLASRHDPFKTPEERNREFLAKVIFTPPPKTRAKMEGATQAERKRLLDEDQKRVSRIEGELGKMGVSFDDLLSGEVALRLKGAPIVKNVIESFGEAKEQRALQLLQGGERSYAEVAKMAGLGEAAVKKIAEDAFARFYQKHGEKFRAGLKAEAMEQGALLAQASEVGSRNAEVGTSEEAAMAEARRAWAMAGFVAPEKQGKMKVVRRKLFVPPKVPTSNFRVPTSDPVPFEPRKQNQIPFEPHQVFRNVEPKPGESIATPTGRVLGQPGLPLYQEMMITRGADVGNIEDVVQVARVAQAANGNAFDMIYEAWIQGILSGPQTNVANFAGNAVSMGWDFSMQRGMESLVNLAYRDADSAQLGEFKHILAGIMPGLQRGISQAARSWRAEADFFKHDVLNQQVEFIESFEKGGGVRASIPGRSGRIIRIPGRALLFMDAAFKGLMGQMEVGAVAYRIVKREGLSGEALSRRMNELVATPGSEAWQKAVAKAVNLTFQDEILTKEKGGGPIEDAVARFNKMRSGSHLIGFFFPFIRTPYNIFKMGLRKTPLGSANMMSRFAQAGFYKIKDGKPVFESYSKAEQVRHLAEQLIAWTTFAALWSATTGDDNDDKKPILFTGSVPASEVKRGERELQSRLHGGAYQIRLGGKNGVNINYGRYEPFATVIGTVVDALTILKKATRGKLSKSDALDSMFGYFIAQAQSKTFLQGFRDIQESMDSAGGGRKGIFDTIRQGLLGGLVPNLIRQPLRNLDEFVRDSKGAGPAYQALPSGSLAQPKVDLFGSEIRKGGNAFSRLFFATGTQVEKDPRAQKIDKLLENFVRQNPSSEISLPSSPTNRSYKNASGEHEMTAEQFHKFSMAAGKLALSRLSGRFTTFQVEHPKEDDVKAVRKAVEDARKEIKGRMFPKGRSANIVREWLTAA